LDSIEEENGDTTILLMSLITYEKLLISNLCVC